jgi:L-rhamnose mutarotase
MEIVGLAYRVRSGRAQDYARRHATTPSQLDALLREAGVRRFAIYLDGETVFAHMEVESFDAMVQRYNDDPVAAAWREEMEGLIEFPDADPTTDWPTPLRRVWTL